MDFVFLDLPDGRPVMKPYLQEEWPPPEKIVVIESPHFDEPKVGVFTKEAGEELIARYNREGEFTITEYERKEHAEGISDAFRAALYEMADA